MSVFGNVSGRDVVKAFTKDGWEVRGQVGRHVVMTKLGCNVNLSVPQHRELGPGLIRSLIRNSGLTVEAFMQLLQ